MKRRVLELLIFAAFSGSVCLAQIDCTKYPYSSDLVCEFPFAVGLYSNATALGPSGVQAPTATQAAEFFNSSVAVQLSQLPLATASAGTILIPKNGAYETIDDLGPILTDRPQTLGKGRLFLGFSAAQYVFTSIDGASLSNLPFTYTSTATNSSGTTVSTTYTTTAVNISLRVDQFVSVATYGLTDRLDITAIIPVSRVAVSGGTTSSTNYVFSGTGGNGTYLYTSNGTTSSARGTESGLGDVTGGFKYAISKSGRSSYSAGFLVRFASGDKYNLLGSGAYGFNPYLVYSYVGNLSPHAMVGYQWNTDTVLNPTSNTITGAPGAPQPLPGGMKYDIGLDWAAKKHLTAALDVLGSQFMNIGKLNQFQTSLQLTSSSNSVPLNTTTYQNSAYSSGEVSTGVKWNPIGKCVIAANILTQFTNTGLKARPTPLLGVSYKF